MSPRADLPLLCFYAWSGCRRYLELKAVQRAGASSSNSSAAAAVAAAAAAAAGAAPLGSRSAGGGGGSSNGGGATTTLLEAHLAELGITGGKRRKEALAEGVWLLAPPSAASGGAQPARRSSATAAAKAAVTVKAAAALSPCEAQEALAFAKERREAELLRRCDASAEAVLAHSPAAAPFLPLLFRHRRYRLLQQQVASLQRVRPGALAFPRGLTAPPPPPPLADAVACGRALGVPILERRVLAAQIEVASAAVAGLQRAAASQRAATHQWSSSPLKRPKQALVRARPSALGVLKRAAAASAEASAAANSPPWQPESSDCSPESSLPEASPDHSSSGGVGEGGSGVLRGHLAAKGAFQKGGPSPDEAC